MCLSNRNTTRVKLGNELEGRRTDHPEGGRYVRYVRNDELRVEARAYVEVVTPIVGIRGHAELADGGGTHELQRADKESEEHGRGACHETNCSPFTSRTERNEGWGPKINK